MPEFTLTTNPTNDTEIIHLFKSEDLRNKFIKSIDNSEDLDKTVKEVREIRQTKDVKRSIGVHLHLIFWGKYERKNLSINGWFDCESISRIIILVMVKSI